MNYVAHICKNKDCNNIFIAEDYTKVKDIPPRWRYCQDCCKSLGLNYEKQTPKNNRTPAENKRFEKLATIGKLNLKNYTGTNDRY